MSRRRNRSHDSEDDSIEHDESSKAKNMTYYDVLGVSSNAPLSEIKKKFRALAVKYHPDKEIGDASVFALVARAYECLSNEDKRDEYDKMLLIEKKAKKSNYINQKKAFEDFIKAQEAEAVTAKTLEHAKAKFNIDYAELDRKRGFDRSNLDNALPPQDAFKRMKDMQMAREQDELEFSQPKIFDSSNFDRNKFNSLFEMKYKNDSDDDEQQLVKRAVPSAFNDLNGPSYSTCDNYDDIFEEGDVQGTDFYGSVKDTGKKIEITKDDLRKLKANKNSYSTHSVLEADYNENIKKKIRDRELEDKLYEERKMQDFDVDDKEYKFLHHVGLTGQEFEWDKEEVDENVLEKLITLRELEQKTSRQKQKKRQ